MNNFLRFTLLSIVIHLIGLSFSFSQSAPIINTNSPIYKAEAFFNSSIKEQSLLFNGTFFKDYPETVDGSANFQDLQTFSKGTIFYHDFRFDSIPLMYDLYEDKIISLLNNNKYALRSDKVSDFYYNNHHFKYINVIDSTKSVIKSGFYDMIYEGKSKILVKRTKTLQVSQDDKSIRYYFQPKTYYYLERGGKYQSITGEKSFLSYFEDRKAELKKQLKENKIKFRKSPEAAMVLLATYYEKLLR